MSEFDGKVALVTGGASGIGRAVSLAFAREGAAVAVADVNNDGAEEVAAACKEQGGDGTAVAMDVTSTASVRDGIDQVLEAWGRIDILANVAGWDRISTFVDTTEEFWDRVIAINFKGVLATCHAVLPHMLERGSGVIVNVASEAGRNGSSGEAVYSGAKGGVIAFTKALTREVARKGIRVNAVAPGLIETPFLDAVREDAGAKIMDAIVASTPVKRTGQPEEVADAVVYLASDRASYIVGQTLSVGGGLSMV